MGIFNTKTFFENLFGKNIFAHISVFDDLLVLLEISSNGLLINNQFDYKPTFKSKTKVVTA